jgi:uncharacterized membrane protein
MSEIPFEAFMIVAFGGTCAIMANMITLIMIGQVNRMLSESDQVSYILWGISKVLRYHRRFYPRSYLRLLLAGLTVLMGISFVAVVWALGLLK